MRTQSSPCSSRLSGVAGRQAAAGFAEGQGGGAGFLGHLVRSVPAAASALRTSEGAFKDRDDVVFLAIDTDEDHSMVKPFLEQRQWNQKVYFEDGLERCCR